QTMVLADIFEPGPWQRRARHSGSSCCFARAISTVCPWPARRSSLRRVTSEFESAERAPGAPGQEAFTTGSLPPPARTGARLRLAALLALGIGCLVTAWQLRGSAGYAL